MPIYLEPDELAHITKGPQPGFAAFDELETGRRYRIAYSRSGKGLPLVQVVPTRKAGELRRSILYLPKTTTLRILDRRVTADRLLHWYEVAVVDHPRLGGQSGFVNLEFLALATIVEV